MKEAQHMEYRLLSVIKNDFILKFSIQKWFYQASHGISILGNTKACKSTAGHDVAREVSALSLLYLSWAFLQISTCIVYTITIKVRQKTNSEKKKVENEKVFYLY